MSELERLLITLHRGLDDGASAALGLALKDDVPLFAVLLVRGNQVVDVLGTGTTPEEACRAALEGLAAPALR